jgi:hypothetical protein
MLFHPNLSFTMKFMILPYSLINRCVNWRYRLSSDGTRWNLSTRLIPSKHQSRPTHVQQHTTPCVLIRCRTSSQLSRWYSESGVPMMLRSLSPTSFRKSGHSAGHWSRGTLTSQNGSGSSWGMVGMSTAKSNQSPASVEVRRVNFGNVGQGWKWRATRNLERGNEGGDDGCERRVAGAR